MSIKDIVRRVGQRHDNAPVRREDDPFRFLQRDMNRLFDDFFADFPLARNVAGASAFTPRVNVSETDREVTVSAELPGMDEKDIAVEMSDSAVTISGERKEEKEEKNKNWHWKEQSYGSFSRTIPLPDGIDGAKAKAQFKKGLLTVAIPKREDKQARRKTIAIEAD